MSIVYVVVGDWALYEKGVGLKDYDYWTHKVFVDCGEAFRYCEKLNLLIQMKRFDELRELDDRLLNFHNEEGFVKYDTERCVLAEPLSSMVEHSTDNRKMVSSILPGATKQKEYEMKCVGGVPIRSFTYTHEDKTTTTVTFVSMSDIPNKYRSEFNKWLGVSTVPYIHGYDDSIYSWDWERWYNLKTNGVATIWD